MAYEPRRDGYRLGYHVYFMYDNRPSKHPAAFKTYVRIPDHIDNHDAEELADAIVLEVQRKEHWLGDVLGIPQKMGDDFFTWQRRLAQCGGIDEMSSGVQATYFSPNGQLVSILAYVDAEWMDDEY